MSMTTTSNDDAVQAATTTATTAHETLIPLTVRVGTEAKDVACTGDRPAREVALEFRCDWDIGIGGSVWTSGEILTSHLEAQQHAYRARFQGKVVVELGSGTGYVGLMTAVCFSPAQVILTDLASHVACMEHNIARNASHVAPTVAVRAMKLSWGDAAEEEALLQAMGPVDIILGTDVAYLSELYEPLLHTLRRLAHSDTLILLGMNRTDTDRTFFHRLEEDGFEYYKIADRLLPAAHRGKDFGLFEIKPRHLGGAILSSIEPMATATEGTSAQ